MSKKTLFKALIHLPFQTLQFAVEARRSDYSIKERIHIFMLMFYIHMKSIFYTEKREVSVNFFGFKFSAPNYLTVSFLFREIFTHGVYTTKSTQANPFIIDCGAHIGMACCFFAYKYPNCKVLAFEPDPLNFKFLQKNIHENKMNVQAFNFALSNQFSERVLFFKDQTPLKGTTYSFYNSGSRSGKSKTVITQPLSHYISKNSNIDLLKIDVEGAEYEIIDNLVVCDMLGNFREIVLEYHPKIVEKKMSVLLKLLEENNFDYRIQGVSYDSFSSNSLIIHAYQKDVFT